MGKCGLTLSSTISLYLLKLMFIESVMPSNHGCGQQREALEPGPQTGHGGSRSWGAGTLGVPLGGIRRVEGLLVAAGRLSVTVSPFRVEQGTSLETPWPSLCLPWQES